MFEAGPLSSGCKLLILKTLELFLGIGVVAIPGSERATWHDRCAVGPSYDSVLMHLLMGGAFSV